MSTNKARVSEISSDLQRPPLTVNQDGKGIIVESPYRDVNLLRHQRFGTQILEAVNLLTLFADSVCVREGAEGFRGYHSCIAGHRNHAVVRRSVDTGAAS